MSVDGIAEFPQFVSYLDRQEVSGGIGGTVALGNDGRRLRLPPFFGSSVPGKTAICVRSAYVNKKGETSDPRNPLNMLERETGFEPATLSLEG
jgi:hypothetical protein